MQPRADSQGGVRGEMVALRGCSSGCAHGCSLWRLALAAAQSLQMLRCSTCVMDGHSHCAAASHPQDSHCAAASAMQEWYVGRWPSGPVAQAIESIRIMHDAARAGAGPHQQPGHLQMQAISKCRALPELVRHNGRGQGPGLAPYVPIPFLNPLPVPLAVAVLFLSAPLCLWPAARRRPSGA